MGKALDLYRRLGFAYAPPAYPTISPMEGAPARPFGAANTHASFPRNFVELLTIVSDDAPVPTDAVLVPLQVPPAVLPRILDAIKRTVGTLSAGLARFEGLHILVFQTDDVAASAAQLDKDGVHHSGESAIQRTIDTTAGPRVAPVHSLEIDREPGPEGRLAIAENPPPEILRSQTHMDHLNGAVDLVESILCVADGEIDTFVQRYSRYLGRDARAEGAVRIFDMEDSRLTLVPVSRLGSLLPGETAPALPAFVAYAVKVRDLHATEALLRRNEVPMATTPAGDVFVPAQAALGAAVIFRQG